jgi:hypothetical protein
LLTVGFRKVDPPVYTGTGAPSAEVQFTMHGVGSDVANGMWIKIGGSVALGWMMGQKETSRIIYPNIHYYKISSDL